MAYIWTITHYGMLTEHVVEIIFELPQILPFVPGQWVLLWFEDEKGAFKRAYSIVNYEVKSDKMYITLIIKLFDDGRWSMILETKKVWDTVDVWMISWRFVLQDTDTPKVFVGTGTGLAPVYNMAKTTKAKDKMLIFSVPYKNDLFYEEQIKNIPDLKYEIHITREEVPSYNFGRFDLSKFDFAPETEFYICGNPEMVKATSGWLKERGFEKVYSEGY